MANRSYLYSCDYVPEGIEQKKALTGISEWNYDIPLVFKLLASGSPKLCKSSIWDMDEKIAIVSSYEEGVANLVSFLDKIDSDMTKSLAEEAKAFLRNEKNSSKYFVLECGEIFDMSGEDIFSQNEALLKDLKNIDQVVAQVIDALAPKQKSFFQRIFSRTDKASEINPTEVVSSLGLGNWSNILYYSFNKST